MEYTSYSIHPMKYTFLFVLQITNFYIKSLRVQEKSVRGCWTIKWLGLSNSEASTILKDERTRSS